MIGLSTLQHLQINDWLALRKTSFHSTTSFTNPFLGTKLNYCQLPSYIHHRATYLSLPPYFSHYNWTLPSFFLYSSSYLLLPILISILLSYHVHFLHFLPSRSSHLRTDVRQHHCLMSPPRERGHDNCYNLSGRLSVVSGYRQKSYMSRRNEVIINRLRIGHRRLTHSVTFLSVVRRRPTWVHVSEMTYTVSSGTLNPSIPYLSAQFDWVPIHCQANNNISLLCSMEKLFEIVDVTSSFLF